MHDARQGFELLGAESLAAKELRCELIKDLRLGLAADIRVPARVQRIARVEEGRAELPGRLTCVLSDAPTDAGRGVEASALRITVKSVSSGAIDPVAFGHAERFGIPRLAHFVAWSDEESPEDDL